MILDLSDPLTGTVIGGLVLMITGGTYHYVLTLIRLKVTDKKFSDVLSELDTIHNNYKQEIADIKKRYSNQLEQSLQLTRTTINLYEKKMDNFLAHNKPPEHPGGLLGYALKNYKK